MTTSFKDDQSCEASKDASTSNRSNFDQETGSSNTLQTGPIEDDIEKGSPSVCLPIKMDRTLLRVVRNCFHSNEACFMTGTKVFFFSPNNN